MEQRAKELEAKARGKVEERKKKENRKIATERVNKSG